jgi:hypothetical protein
MPGAEPETNFPTPSITQGIETKVNVKDVPGPPAALRNINFFPRPPRFKSKEEEREFLKFRLAQAFRIFGNQG